MWRRCSKRRASAVLWAGRRGCGIASLVPAKGSRSFDLQFLGAGAGRDACVAETQQAWRDRLASASPLRLPDPALQHAFDASLRQLLAMIEPWGKHARVLKGLEHYYGANPYDTFQASRALDAVGLHAEARELLRHQLEHLKADGLFEMWETGDLSRAGADQWIVQGLAASALWSHYRATGDEAWLRVIAPALVEAAQATLRIRRESCRERTGKATWRLPVGSRPSAAMAAWAPATTGRRTRARWPGCGSPPRPPGGCSCPRPSPSQPATPSSNRRSTVCGRSRSRRRGCGMIPAFPGAAGKERTRPLWGVVMSVTAFDGIPDDDPAAVATLRFLQQHQQGGLHLNLGYSAGVWPYLSAEVAQWHLRLGEREEAWRILRAIVERASSTVCWYEEVEPHKGHCDPADVWAAAEVVYLSAELLKPAPGTLR